MRLITEGVPNSTILWEGDCLAVLAGIPDNTIDAIITDPPYGLEFMGREWDGADGFKRSLNPNDAGRGDVFGRTSRKAPEYRTAGTGQKNKPGLGERDTEWVSNQGWNQWRCAECGHLPHGGSPCTCENPRMVRADNRWNLYQEWCQVWAEECLRILKPGGWFATFGGTRTFHRLAVAVEDAGFDLKDTIAWIYGCHDRETELLTARGWVNGLELTDDDLVAQWATDGTITLVKPTARQRYPYDGRMVRFRHSNVDQLVTPNHRVYRQVIERQQIAGIRTSKWSEWQVDQAADINRWQPMRFPAAGIHDGDGIGGEDYAALLGWVWAEGGFDLTGSGVRIYQSSTNQPFVDEISALLDRLGPHKRYDYQRKWKGRPYTATTWFMSGDLANRVRADLPGKTPTWELLWRMTAAEKRVLWDAAMKGDGSKTNRVFWQKDRASLEWVQALLACIEARGKISYDPRGSLNWQQSATVELQRRHLVDDGEDYTGEVWCVTVPSGAFVIRRNGLVSVSGNSGFPKSVNIGKAIDKHLNKDREVVAPPPYTRGRATQSYNETRRVSYDYPVQPITAPGSPEAEQWDGWGSALKPAYEPIILARKPLDGTLAVNTLKHGVGGLNIDAARVPTSDNLNGGAYATAPTERTQMWGDDAGNSWRRGGAGEYTPPTGRWPANVVLDPDAAVALDEDSGLSSSRVGTPRASVAPGDGWGMTATGSEYDDQGGASRFFYTAKADARERPVAGGVSHPTVKPLDLLRWLTRLLTPPGGDRSGPFRWVGDHIGSRRYRGVQICWY